MSTKRSKTGGPSNCFLRLKCSCFINMPLMLSMIDTNHPRFLTRMMAGMYWSLRSTWSFDAGAAFAVRMALTASCIPIVIVLFDPVFNISAALSTMDHFASAMAVFPVAIMFYWLIARIGPSTQELARTREKRIIRYIFALLGWTIVAFVGLILPAIIVLLLY